MCTSRFTHNIGICHGCPPRLDAARAVAKRGGFCPKDQKPLHVHAEEDSCPLDYYKLGLPPKPSTDCTRRGEVIREQKCVSCTGEVRIKVFACGVDARGCTIATKIDGLRCCTSCKDRSPPTPKP